MESTTPGTPPSEKPSEQRLDSWKEIAGYLGRDVKTVQRWEKREGMPVHRHLHDKRGSVYALAPELDHWMQGRRARLGEEEGSKAVEAEMPTVPQVTEPISPLRARPAPRWAVIAGLAVVILLALAGITYRGHTQNLTSSRIRSLAVLPLKNLSGDSTQEYLADGMTEALIGRLSEIHDLGVISRTSSMRFKNPQLSVPEIARTLGVDAIVEGAVMREGNRIRVTARLIRAATDEQLLSETYDREIQDALTLQGELPNP